MARTSTIRAGWSALIALAIVVGMFTIFYELSTRNDQMATATHMTTAAAPQTTGQGAAH